MTAAVKERPILFSAPMVRALLDGSKTQTRRIMKPQPVPVPNRPGDHWWPCNAFQSMVSVADVQHPAAHGMAGDACPHGGHGDRLWVRETWAPHPDFPASTGRTVYRADPECEYDVARWHPSIHMFRRDSRILLEIVSVRVERLNDCSAPDAWAEGIPHSPDVNPTHEYEELWQRINGAGSWAANPWVWVLEFKRVTP